MPRQTIVKDLEVDAHAQAQTLGHALGPWSTQGVHMLWRKATCAKCDNSAVYYLSDPSSLSGGVLTTPCDGGIMRRRRAHRRTLKTKSSNPE